MCFENLTINEVKGGSLIGIRRTSVERQPQVFRYIAGAEDRGKTLEEILRRGGLSGRRIRRLAREKKILVNGRVSFLAKPMKPGDRVEADLREIGRKAGTTESNPSIPILYEDDWVLVIDKPAGLVVHAPAPARRTGRPGTTSLADILHSRGAAANPPWVPHLVHRLDRDTGGVLLAAKSAHIHARLDRALREGGIHRIYSVVAEGNAMEIPERIELPVAPDPGRPGRFRPAEPGDAGAKPAVTRVCGRRFIPLPAPAAPRGSPLDEPRWSALSGVTFLDVSLETGRTHQIRVHLSALGHPILGDRWYGSRHPNLPLMLFARSLTFPHPADGHSVEVAAPFPETWRPWLTGAPAGET
ncbi:pseudouridine synthase [Kyrpidia tusciae DSM 2912]|uniref:RNA pseudouridylate synthase n=1 Tax=Kyrpidia tusciae (strain DSM 2912 / NBRC 15312 / T2) TaxID=562970 RepID=D5WQ17_KYRT2|nr:pseudouridine synthase [Kyrpidia tusciae DSM 2912]